MGHHGREHGHSELVSQDIQEEQKLLEQDDRIKEMARQVGDSLGSDHLHASGLPRSWFMGACTAEYVRLCERDGVTPAHKTIGGVARAVVSVARGEGVVGRG